MRPVERMALREGFVAAREARGERVFAGTTAASALRSAVLARSAFASPVRMLTLGDSWLARGMSNLAEAMGQRGYECRPEHNLAGASQTLNAIANAAKNKAVALLPKVELVLVDGGGNDVHKGSYFGGPDSNLDDMLERVNGKVDLNEDAVKRFIDGRLREDMSRLLGTLVAAVEPPPIVVVAYDHPIPDGRRGFFGFVGPWLRPAFERPRLGMNLDDPVQLKQASVLMARLIDRLNLMIKNLVKTDFPGRDIYPIDLTGTLKSADHTDDWEDELHPRAEGDGLLADRLIELLPASLPKPR
jgi:hypothetical protein